jgi:protein-tyrosine phosphatase
MPTSLGLDPVAAEVLADRGIGLSGHQPRSITAPIIRTDGADLIITMTRAHLRTVVALEPASFGRTFTLKEMSRRTTPSPTRVDWLRLMHEGRRAADLIQAHPDDDIEDPYGRGIERVRRVTDEIDGLCRGLADAWPAE